MFREIMGLPGHALVVHAAVVFVPLLALLAAGYAVLPRWRARLDWAVAGLAVIAPLSAFLAKQSGEEFEQVLTEKGYPPQILDQVAEHADYGDLLFWFTLGLAVAAALLLVVTKRWGARLPSWLSPVLAVVVIALAVLTAWYVYLTGDTGARAVWEGVL